ncbi:MAG: hypothetical protein JO249_13455 [Acidobacteria bacterium]|nr:hypothetical protein [Acidobacteriota bacterium]
MPCHILAATAILASAGCASTQVNRNTLDIASTYDQLITKQVTFNLEKTIESPFSVPAFVRVNVQSATTMNSINPSLTFPLTAQVSKLAQSMMAPSGLTTQFSNTNQLAGESFSIGGSNQWNQTFS